MAGDLNTRIIISARDDSAKVFLGAADNLKVVAAGAEKVSQALGGAMSTEVVARRTAELSGSLASLSRHAAVAGKDMSGLGDSCKVLAAQAGLPEKEFARLQERMLKTQAAKAAGDSLRAVGEAAGLSSRELASLGRRLGLTEQQIAAADKASAGMIGRLGVLEGAISRAVVAFGAWKLGDFAKDAAMAAARYETLGVVMDVVGKNAGISRATMESTAASLQKQGIAMLESRDATVKLTQAGIDLAEANKLGRIAQDAAVIGQMNSSQAFMHMVAAIQTAQPEMLRTIGLTVSFEDAYRQLAAQMGKNAESLTEQEKMQARVNSVLEAGQRIAGTYEASMTTAGKQISSFTRYLDDLKTVGGQALQEGLAASVELATKKVKELTEYLKTAEAKEQIAAIGKTGQETFASLVSGAEKAGSFLSGVVSGWNSLPTVIQEIGLIAAVVGGTKAVAAIAVITKTIGEIKQLGQQISDTWKVASGEADDDTKIRVLEQDRQRVLSGWSLTRKGDHERNYAAHQLELEIQAIRDRRESLKAEQAMLNDSLAQPVNTNTKPVIKETWGDLVSQKSKLFTGGGDSSLSDQTRRDNAQKEFQARYALSQRMYAMAAGDSAKMAQAVAVERDAYHALGKELESIAQKHTGVAKANAETIKVINEARFKALEAEAAAGTGDKWELERLKVNASYQSAVDELNNKLADYKGTERSALEQSVKGFAERERAAKLAKIDVDEWIESMKRAGDLESQIGQLAFDPSRAMAGQKEALTAEWQAAVRTAGGNQAEISRINELYQLKEVQLREDALGEIAKLDGAYWQRRREGLQATEKFLKQQGVNEHALAVFYAQEKDKIAKGELEARIGYEENFGSYLKDRIALNYGLYKDSATQTVETWGKAADAIIKGFDGIENAVSTVFGAGLTDIVVGKFQGMQHYIDSMLSSLKQVLIAWLADMAKIAVRNYIVVPIMGQIVGTEGSFDLEGGSAGGSKSSGFSLSSASKYAGYAKDGYSLYNSLGSTAGYSASALGSASGAFSNTMSTTSLTGYQALHAADSAAVSSLGAGGGGLVSSLGAGAAAGGLGYMAGSFIRPDNPTASYVGAGAGLAAGTIAGMAGLGALSATGVGALVAVPAALVAGLATPETTKSTWNTAPGSGQAVFIVNGDVVPTSYGVLKQETSGMFGSSSTTHQTVFQAATGEMVTAEQNAWTAATAGLTSFTSSLNIGSKEVEEATQGFVFPMTAVPEGYEDVTYKNIANAETEYTLTNLGLLDSIKAVAKEGEYYIDTVTRLGTTMASMSSIAMATGVDMDAFIQGMDRIAGADFISRLAEAAGGMDALGAAMARLGKYAYSSQEQLANSLNATAIEAGKSIAGIGDMSVTIDNFWQRFRQAMEAGMDPSQMAAWTAASAKMEAWEVAKANAQQIETQAIQKNISAMQAQISVLEQVSQAWENFSDQLTRLKHSLLMDSALSSLSPEQKMHTATARVNALVAEARSGDSSHLSDIDQAIKDELQATLDYYGATTDYYAVYEERLSTLDQLQSLAASQVSQADMQIAQINFQIEQGNAQISALNTINSGIGEVVNAVNNVSSAIGGAIQAANAAQQSVSVPQWSAVAVAADSVAASSLFGLPESTDGNAYQDYLKAMGFDVPAYSGGGLNPGGWFVAGDDPFRSDSGELFYSSGPVRVFNNQQSRALLSPGSDVDTSGIEARLDALSGKLAALIGLTSEGNGDRRGGNRQARGRMLEQAGRR